MPEQNPTAPQGAQPETAERQSLARHLETLAGRPALANSAGFLRDAARLLLSGSPEGPQRVRAWLVECPPPSPEMIEEDVICPPASVELERPSGDDYECGDCGAGLTERHERRLILTPLAPLAGAS